MKSPTSSTDSQSPCRRRSSDSSSRSRIRPHGPFGIRNQEKFKRLEENLYELKAAQVRLLFFIEGRSIVIVTNGFLKKTRKTPDPEIRRARTLRALYLEAKQQ